MSAQVLGPRANRAAIRHVHDSGRDAERAQPLQALQKSFFLLVRLLRREIFRRRKMRERSFQLDVRALRQQFSRTRPLRSAEFPAGSCPY